MRLMHWLAAAALTAGYSAATIVVHAAPAAGGVPDFSAMTRGWLAMGPISNQWPAGRSR